MSLTWYNDFFWQDSEWWGLEDGHLGIEELPVTVWTFFFVCSEFNVRQTNVSNLNGSFSASFSRYRYAALIALQAGPRTWHPSFTYLWLLAEITGDHCRTFFYFAYGNWQKFLTYVVYSRRSGLSVCLGSMAISMSQLLWLERIEQSQ